MADPEPANTKMRVEMNSDRPALSVSGWLASPGVPIVILYIGMLLCDNFVSGNLISSIS